MLTKKTPNSNGWINLAVMRSSWTGNWTVARPRPSTCKVLGESIHAGIENFGGQNYEDFLDSQRKKAGLPPGGLGIGSPGSPETAKPGMREVSLLALEPLLHLVDLAVIQVFQPAHLPPLQD